MAEQTKIEQSAFSQADSGKSYPVTVIEPGADSFGAVLREAWRYRELLGFLAWRDILVRYKQTIFGIGWAIINPLVTMIVFTLVFGKIAKLDQSTGLPPEFYPVFLYTALLPWTYFARSVISASGGIVANSHLITKVYFPRIILPFASAIGGLVDLAFSLLVMAGMMLWFGVPVSWSILAFVPAIFLAFLLAVSVGLLFGSANVRWRDVGFLLGFIVQLWLYLSPVVYSLSMIKKEQPEFAYVLAFNPMTGILETSRWAFLGNMWEFPAAELGIAAAEIFLVLCIGLWYFRRVERTFADVI